VAKPREGGRWPGRSSRSRGRVRGALARSHAGREPDAASGGEGAVAAWRGPAAGGGAGLAEAKARDLGAGCWEVGWELPRVS
jgi:hypothetical protein